MGLERSFEQLLDIEGYGWNDTHASIAIWRQGGIQ